jgi:hypothetical protein
MKCSYCNKKINELKPHIITPPDGDIYHEDCYEKYKKERDHFFNTVIQDDQKFADYMGIPLSMIKK